MAVAPTIRCSEQVTVTYEPCTGIPLSICSKKTISPVGLSSSGQKRFAPGCCARPHAVFPGAAWLPRALSARWGSVGPGFRKKLWWGTNRVSSRSRSLLWPREANHPVGRIIELEHACPLAHRDGASSLDITLRVAWSPKKTRVSAQRSGDRRDNPMDICCLCRRHCLTVMLGKRYANRVTGGTSVDWARSPQNCRSSASQSECRKKGHFMMKRQIVSKLVLGGLLSRRSSPVPPIRRSPFPTPLQVTSSGAMKSTALSLPVFCRRVPSTSSVILDVTSWRGTWSP